MVLKEWLNIWQRTYKRPYVKESTYHDILHYTRCIKSSSLGILKLSELTPLHIQQYINTIPKSRKKELICIYLKSALEQACVLDYIVKNPFKGVTKDKKIKNTRISLNVAQQKALLKYIKGSDIEELILFYLLTGVRRKEALTVKIEDIDTKHNQIHIKGTKTANSDRYIPLSKKYIRHLLKLKTSGKYLFNYHPDYITHKIHEIFNKLEIPACTHCLRHTFSTNQLYLGTPDKFRQEWLGHASLQMTNNVYTHIDRSLDKKHIIKLYNGMYHYIKR